MNASARRLVPTLSAAFLFLAAPRGAACPSCAGSEVGQPVNIWPAVGAFLLVPPLLAGAVVWTLRREFRSGGGAG